MWGINGNIIFNNLDTGGDGWEPSNYLNIGVIMKQLSKKELLDLAKLSRLELDEKESEALIVDLSKILDYFSSLQSINTDQAKVTGHPLKTINNDRLDEISPSMDIEDVLKNAPFRKDDFFKIKKVLDK